MEIQIATQKEIDDTFIAEWGADYVVSKGRIHSTMFLASYTFHSMPRKVSIPRQELMPGVAA
jgi:hypothetical protein